MTMSKKKKSFCITFVILLLLEIVCSAFAITASAEDVTYESSVIDDLSKDSSFNYLNYPSDKSNYSLGVIQIAESTNGSLYIYVYNPSKETMGFRAQFINMSLENPSDKNLENDITYQRYSLTWVNSYGVLEKYKVDNFTVSNNADRHYNIAAIYRPYDKQIDKNYDLAVDTVQCVGISVGQYWHVYKYNGNTVYENKKVDVIQVNINATGSIRYQNGIELGNIMLPTAADSHYAAFSVEGYNIQELYDADITYTIVNYKRTYTYGLTTTETITELSRKGVEREFISSKETRTHTGRGWFGKDYTWQRIQTVEQFKKQAEDDANKTFSDEELEGLNKSQYVFRFVETPYAITLNTSTATSAEYSVTEYFGVLRLHFLCEGQYYNIGAVSDLVGTDSTPELDVGIDDNVVNTIEDILESEWWQKLMMLLGLVLFVVVLNYISGPLGFIFKILWNGIKYILDKIVWVITLPFVAIENIIKGARGQKAKKPRYKKRD